MRRDAGELGRDRRAATAVEFAIVSLPFFALVLGIIAIGLNFYMQEVLDLALQTAVRQVQLGRVPASYSVADFTGRVFCPILSTYTPCAGLVLTVQPVVDYKSDAAVAMPAPGQLGRSHGYCVGAPGQLMFARVVYALPIIGQIWPFGTQATVGGTTGAVLVSGAAFANENPAGAAVSAVGGC